MSTLKHVCTSKLLGWSIWVNVGNIEMKNCHEKCLNLNNYSFKTNGQKRQMDRRDKGTEEEVTIKKMKIREDAGSRGAEKEEP